MVEEKKINLSVNEGVDFFANEISVNFSPMHFNLDFKCITPRVDMRSRDSTILSIKHNVVILDPYHLKNLHEILGDVMKKYEKKFGKIKKPTQLTKAEKNMKDKINENDLKTKTVPNYLG
ncbi:MAG: DUF3467 domain-containing protein [Candidatus Woesearchaeota archaeon]